MFAFVPVVLVLGIMLWWSLNVGEALYALARMLLQLVVIGYLLVFIFAAEQSALVMLVLFVMLMAAGWISLNTVKEDRMQLLPVAVVALLLGCGLTLVVIILAVVRADPWYDPQFVIPLAGMIFANSMNSVSLAAERFTTELEHGTLVKEAKVIAMNTGMIPVINSLFAVGLVALPGMMTGQILSGVSPLIAVRYQIMIMCMMFGASGISMAIFLWWTAKVRFADQLKSQS